MFHAFQKFAVVPCVALSVIAGPQASDPCECEVVEDLQPGPAVDFLECSLNGGLQVAFTKLTWADGRRAAGDCAAPADCKAEVRAAVLNGTD